MAETEIIHPHQHWGTRGTAAATIAAKLSFANVSHNFGARRVLSDISFDVEPGQILCLLGQSGSGKSTLLRIAAGLEPSHAGSILINDKEIGGPGRFLPPDKRGIGLMFQDYALFPHLTIEENVAFGLGALGRRAAKREAGLALARVGLDIMRNAYPHMLSGGEQQRVALARAIAPRPAVLLMDEPFSGLDRALRHRVRDETLAVLRETRATCIIVTHDPEEAMRMGDSIALLRDGCLAQLGSVRNLYEEPADLFVAQFFSETNLLEAVAEDGAVTTPIGRHSAKGIKRGDKVEICIRPQGIIVQPKGGDITGLIVRRVFAGEADLLEVAIEGLEIPLTAKCRNGGDYSVGSEVSVSADEREIFVFKNGWRK